MDYWTLKILYTPSRRRLLFEAGLAVALVLGLAGCELLGQREEEPEPEILQEQTIETPPEPTPEVQGPELKGRLETVPALVVIGQDFRAIINSNIRGGPGMNYVITGLLPEDKLIYVRGKVIGRNWFAVTKNGERTDYVHTSLLVPEVRRMAGEQSEAADTRPLESIAERLSADQIRSSFNDKSVVIVDVVTQRRWVEYYGGEDNLFIRSINGEIHNGQWVADDTNSQLCRAWTKNGALQQRCYTVYFDGNVYHLEAKSTNNNAPIRLKVIKMVTGNKVDILTKLPSSS